MKKLLIFLFLFCVNTSNAEDSDYGDEPTDSYQEMQEPQSSEDPYEQDPVDESIAEPSKKHILSPSQVKSDDEDYQDEGDSANAMQADEEDEDDINLEEYSD